MKQEDKKRRKKGRAIRVGLIGVLVLGGITTLFLIMNRQYLYRGAAHLIHGQVNKSIEVDSLDLDRNKMSGTQKQLELDRLGTSNYPARSEDGIYNFLFFGIEKIHNARNTDSMILVTLNTRTHQIKLTSLMRDSYVSIPGYHDNKLNSAYAKGGIDLLADTIEKNYKVRLDGYASVDFDSFEHIVDLLGGVDIELSAEEAYYLDTKDYVSKSEYRTLVEGNNHLNGNQTLGYCRVRYVKTPENEANDYGRTLRQRKVMKQLFQSYKDLSIWKLLNVSKECLRYVTTDLTEDTISIILETLMENPRPEIETFRVPVNGGFQDPKIYEGVTYPLVYDWEKNLKQLFMFIFGDTEQEAMNNLKNLAG